MTTMDCDIDILPTEVLHVVFTYLSIPDRLNACLVCKKWLETINCKYLMKDFLVHISDNRAVPIFASMSRNFINFSFQLILVDNKYYELFKRFSSHIEYLSFENCGIWHRDPVKFDLTYDNLKVLKIIDCELWTLVPSLPNLSEFHLIGKSSITDDGFNVLQKTMKHLKVLSLLCNVSYERKIYRRFYPLQMTYETNPSTLILSLPAIQSFISERATTLKELNFSSSLTPLALTDIASIKNLNLTKIDLSNCFECSNGLTELFKSQPNLKIVSLNGIRNVNDDIVDALCSLVPDVEEILLHYCSLTEKSLNKLFQLSKLKKLDIGGNQPVSVFAFNKAVLNFKAFQLKSLTLSHLLKDEEYGAIDLLFRKCKYLVYLDISCCTLSDLVVHSISKNLIHLEYLNLKHTCITDYGITGHADNLRPYQAHLVFKDKTPLSNLKNLRTLKLNHCDKITRWAAIKTIKFPCLEYLNVSWCKFDANTLLILLDQNPSIKKIYWDGDASVDPRIRNKRLNKYFDEFLQD